MGAAGAVAMGRSAVTPRMSCLLSSDPGAIGIIAGIVRTFVHSSNSIVITVITKYMHARIVITAVLRVLHVFMIKVITILLLLRVTLGLRA